MMRALARVVVSGFFVAAMAALLVAQGPPRANLAPASERGGTSVPDAVMQRALSAGAARIIVGLNVRVAPEGGLDADGISEQRGAIAAAQADVLSLLAGRPLGDVKTFHIIPAMALEADVATLDLLRADPRVAYIEEDRLSRPGLDHSVNLIGAPIVWGASGHTGSGQTVAILDTGVERTHSFFGSRVVSEACYSTTSAPESISAFCASGSTSAGAAAPCDDLDDCYHGTHVAGIAAGSGPSFHGVARGANIIAIQVFSRVSSAANCSPNAAPCAQAFTSDLIAGLQRVFDLRTTFNIAAANMSLGGGQFTSACDSQSPSMKSIIDSLRDAGIATVVSSGNSSFVNALSFPSCISTAISVGSTTDGGVGSIIPDVVSTFSNSASFLSLLAPGQMITSAMSNNHCAATGAGASCFGALQGTSMAAPHVAGTWALLKSRYTGASVTQILSALTTTGQPVPDSRNGLTKPRIRVDRALSALAVNCTFSLDSSAASVGAAGGSGSVGVTTQPGCAWTAASNNTSIATITGGASGLGSGTVSYAVSAHVSTSGRSTTLTIGGQTFTINQAGVPVVSGVRSDFNSDGKMDLLWHHRVNGNIAVWYMNGLTRIDAVFLSPGAVPDTNWQPVGVGDFNADGKQDVLWQHMTSGALFVWFMNGVTQTSGSFLSNSLSGDPRWRVRAVTDLNGDGKVDIILQHPNDGLVAAWLMNGVNLVDGSLLNPGFVSPDWRVAGSGDFNADGKQDLILQRNDGFLAAWFMNGINRIDAVFLSPNQIADTRWLVGGVGDVNGDGKPDLILHHLHDGVAGVWLMNGVTLADGGLFVPSTVPDANWRIVGPR